MFKFSETSKKRLDQVNYQLVEVTERALELTPIDFGIAHLGGYRTPQEQRKLYLDGKSNCDGQTKLSEHQKGNAIDVYAWTGGRASWDMEHLAIIAVAHLQAGHILGIPVAWGGLWTSIVDGPHIYLLHG